MDASAEPPKADAITVEEIAAADKLAGRSYTMPERELMVKSLEEMRGSLRAVRQTDIAPDTEPATSLRLHAPARPLPSGKSAFHLSHAATVTYDGNPESLAFASAGELGHLIKARKITSVALTEMYLNRLKTYGPRLNCVVTLTEERAREQATRADRELAVGKYRGPLHGVPYGAKDLLATRGIPTTWGASPYKNQIFDYDATVIHRLEEAGAILVAKLSMGELAMCDVWFGGKTRNPWNPAQGSSGSSAGSGSATAAGLVGFAIGTETHGSITSPSNRNGVTGLRPTYGRISRHGAMALCWTMDKIGPMARGVEDCALLLSVLHGPDGLDPTVADVPFLWNGQADLKGLQIGLDQAAFEALDKEHKPVYEEALSVLRKLGAELKPITLPHATDAYKALVEIIISVESAAAFAQLTASGRVSELVQQDADAWPNTFRLGSTIPAIDYLQALRVRTRLQAEMEQVFQNIDLYVTTPLSSPTIGFTNLTGHPSLLTRCGMLDSVPQSIEFIGDLYHEEAILRAGLAFERATSWHTQWPDVSKLPATPPPPMKEE